MLDVLGRCPPDDCGGAPGYENLLVILAGPDHEEHDEMLVWCGGQFGWAPSRLIEAPASPARKGRAGSPSMIRSNWPGSVIGYRLGFLRTLSRFQAVGSGRPAAICSSASRSSGTRGTGGSAARKALIATCVALVTAAVTSRG
jgi:hypothetical protein